MKRKHNRNSEQSGQQPAATGDALRREWWRGALLTVIVLLAYLPVWHAGFIWDDDTFLTNNPLIRATDGLYQFWCTTTAPDYFPLTSTTLWLEWRLWGGHPLGYHLINLLLHTLSAFVLWRVLARLKIPGAWLAAALFAVHPVNVESVAWITERKNTLAMFFYALTLLWYLYFEDTGRRRWYWLALGAFLLAMLSKTSVAPLPLVLLGLAWWRGGKVTLHDLRRSVPFFAVAGGLALVTIWFQSHRAIGSTIVRTDGIWARLAGAGWAVWFYLDKALLPSNLCFVYPRWEIDTGRILAFAPGLLLALWLLLCWHWRRQWGKAWLLALGYFVLMLLPVLGFFDIYFMRFSPVADHWQYFAILGPLALAAAGLTRAFRRWRVTGYLVNGTLVMVLGVLTWRQGAMYADQETLWRTTIAHNPTAFMPENNLGELLLREGWLEEAKSHFETALRLKPDYAEAHNNLGSVLEQMGRLDEAVAEYRTAVKLAPAFVPARSNLGGALGSQEHFIEAISVLEDALRRDPTLVLAHDKLAFAFYKQGQFDDAIAHAREAIRLDPEYNGSRNVLAAALVAEGKLDEAITEFTELVRRQPDFADAHNNLGVVLMRRGRLTEAVLQFQDAIRLKPDFTDAKNNLATTLERQGESLKP